MTLKELFEKLNEIALKQPYINEIIRTGNIYDLSTYRDVKYAAFCPVQATHSADITNGTSTYNWFLYVVDRLSSDKNNKIDVQSTALETLKNILRTLEREEDVEYSNVDFTVFTESFAGECAGAYASVGIVVPDDNCIDLF